MKKVEDWTGKPCAVCKGTGEDNDARACQDCGGTGDEYGPIEAVGSEKAGKARPHPMQEVEVAADGVIRFRHNPLVQALQRHAARHGLDLNALFHVAHAKEDWSQLLQLLGYSVNGYGDCSEIVEEHLEAADEAAEALSKALPTPGVTVAK